MVRNERRGNFENERSLPGLGFPKRAAIQSRDRSRCYETILRADVLSVTKRTGRRNSLLARTEEDSGWDSLTMAGHGRMARGSPTRPFIAETESADFNLAY